MRNIFIVSIALLVLSGCSQPAPTIEEKVLMRMFAAFYAGDAFDYVCNKTDPKSKYDFSKTENVLRMGNMQMLAARIGGLQLMRNKDMSVDEGVKKLTEVSEKIEAKASEVLAEKGCDSKEAQAMKNSLKLFSTVHPSTVFGMLEKQIVKEGGVSTTEADIEKVRGKHEQKAAP